MTYRIHVDVSSSDRSLAARQFERICKDIRDSNYAFGGVSGAGAGGGGGPSMSLTWEVSGPPEKPLSDVELRRLREMLK